jgi:glutamate synthase domain-containing protein 1
MCGIVGFWDKNERSDGPLGLTLLKMLEALACRGPDSTGVAVFGAGTAGQFVARVKVGDNGSASGRAGEISAAARDFGASGFSQTGAYLRFALDAGTLIPDLLKRVESIAHDVEVVSVGRHMEIVKEVGSPSNLESTFGISRFQGTHGLGHTRLSTESIVDLSHSQPFWGHLYPDLAIVHNGHITNYHQLRRRYQQRGVRFYTENDSEIIAIFVAERLQEGMTLAQALQRIITDLDGSFCCLAATSTAFGFVKDPFAFKPLVFAETDQFVSVATEEIAIRRAIPGSYDVREAQAKEVRTWQR